MTLRPDAVRRTHSVWFHFTREPRYFSGIDEIREPQKDWRSGSNVPTQIQTDGTFEDGGSSQRKWNPEQNEYNPLGRLPGSVWTIPSEPLLIPDDTRTVRTSVLVLVS